MMQSSNRTHGKSVVDLVQLEDLGYGRHPELLRLHQRPQLLQHLPGVQVRVRVDKRFLLNSSTTK